MSVFLFLRSVCDFGGCSLLQPVSYLNLLKSFLLFNILVISSFMLNPCCVNIELYVGLGERIMGKDFLFFLLLLVFSLIV